MGVVGKYFGHLQALWGKGRKKGAKVQREGRKVWPESVSSSSDFDPDGGMNYYGGAKFGHPWTTPTIPAPGSTAAEGGRRGRRPQSGSSPVARATTDRPTAPNRRRGNDAGLALHACVPDQDGNGSTHPAEAHCRSISRVSAA